MGLYFNTLAILLKRPKKKILNLKWLMFYVAGNCLYNEGFLRSIKQ